MNKETWPVPRRQLFYGKVVYYDEETWTEKKSRDILFKAIANPYEFTFLFDLFYETPSYNCYFNKTSQKEIYLAQQAYLQKEKFIMNCMQLNNLLQVTGFRENLSKQDCMDIKNNIFNGKFAFMYPDLFGYQLKEESYWENGILKQVNYDEYNKESYKLVNENKLSDYFSILTSKSLQGTSDSFQPLEEEGSIRKRILN